MYLSFSNYVLSTTVIFKADIQLFDLQKQINKFSVKRMYGNRVVLVLTRGIFSHGKKSVLGEKVHSITDPILIFTGKIN